MAKNSRIEWTDHTFNPWIGCTNVSPGCDNCYAEAWSKRSGLVKWGNNPRRRTTPGYWRSPLRWQSAAAHFYAAHRRKQRVFCASLADAFDNQVDPAWRADLFSLIRECPDLDWLLLTKRPQNIRKMLPKDWENGYHNVWLGCTAEDQKRFDQRWPHMVKVPAVVRFVSYEPALAPLRMRVDGPFPDWLISGGESGGRARPMHPQWARDVINDCRRLGIAAFHKQWGNYRNNPLVVEGGKSADEAGRVDPHGKGGSLLDGKVWREFPVPRENISRAA